MNGKIFTIKNLCTGCEEEFYFIVSETEKHNANEWVLEKYLAEQCYCDKWEFVKAAEVADSYEEERKALIEKYNSFPNCNFNEDFAAGATNESISREIENFRENSGGYVCENATAYANNKMIEIELRALANTIAYFEERKTYFDFVAQDTETAQLLNTKIEELKKQKAKLELMKQ